MMFVPGEFDSLPLTERLQTSDAFRSAMMASALDAIVSIDEAGKILDFNPAAERTFGYKAEEVRGKLLSETIVPPKHRAAHAAGVQRYQTGAAPRILGQRVEIEGQHADGRLIPLELTVTEVKTTTNRFFTAYLRDISERVAAQKALERLAFVDGVTGLPNAEAMRRWVTASEGTQEPVRAVLVVFLLEVREWRASFGRALTARILQCVAERISDAARENDAYVARAADAQFTCAVSGEAANRAAMDALGQRVGAALDEPVRLEDRVVYLHHYVGIADENGLEGRPRVELLHDADMAGLRRVKRVTWFDETFRTSHQAEVELEGDLREALRRDDQIWVAYQPIVEMQTEKLTGFESLVRWTHPTRGPIAPLEFIPMAERTGMIARLGECVMAQVAKMAAELAAAGHALPLAVNLSAHELSDQTWHDRFKECLRLAGVRSGAIKLELTESALVIDPQSTMLLLRELKDAGTTVSIDDFGTGYSSLSYLKQFSVDTLKIDRSFVMDMHLSQQNVEIVRISIELAHVLGLTVVAEGVETQEQRRVLQDLGCDFAQGYFFAKPMRGDSARAMLDAGGYLGN